MAELTRAEELVQAMDRDPGFRSAVEAAPTAAAKRQLIDERGFADVSLDDMRAWVESKGGKIVIQPGGRELTDAELDVVAGGLTSQEEMAIGAGVGVGVAVGVGAAATAAVVIGGASVGAAAAAVI